MTNTKQAQSKEQEWSAVIKNFYDLLPFNFKGSVETHAQGILSSNSVLNYPMLPTLLGKGKASVLEIGCGAGWLSNSISHYYSNPVTAIDLSSTAITRAKDVAQNLGLNVNFQMENLFKFEPKQRYDLVVSLGVLHHTGDCEGALARICNEFIGPNGYALIGLYHSYGRAPFLKHFAGLREGGASDQELLQEYGKLHANTADSTHLDSWFRDQVLHPYETQHSLKEICGLLDTLEMELMATSINGFQPFDDRDTLFLMEKTYAEKSVKRLKKNEFFPGFFVFLAKKRQKTLA